jgi:hypothetical protein
LSAVKLNDASQVLNTAGVEFDTIQALLRVWLGSLTVSLEQIPAEIPFIYAPIGCWNKDKQENQEASQRES